MTFSLLIFLVNSKPFEIAFVDMAALGTIEPRRLHGTSDREGRWDGEVLIWDLGWSGEILPRQGP